MKKLKCEDCGGQLTIDEGGEFATCEYCHTKYKLNEDKTIIIKTDVPDKLKVTPLTPEQQKDFDKTMNKFSIVVIAIVILVILLIGVAVYKVVSTGVTSTDVSSFNWKYEQHTGTQSCFFMSDVFEEAIKNNKTNKNHKIEFVYNDYKTSDPEEISKIKKEICPNNTSFDTIDVTLDYDKKGYVNKITLK